MKRERKNIWEFYANYLLEPLICQITWFKGNYYNNSKIQNDDYKWTDQRLILFEEVNLEFWDFKFNRVSV